MKYLNKITISNARRFSKDVKIDLSNGATILLAPNGTGKTTIFEAIELALTGSIKRLRDNPAAFIRENESELEIRLDFDEGLNCTVKYRRGSEPELSGDHNLILNNRNKEDLPDLLRLTHILEQRGENWFVQGTNSDAGNLLDKLSIGRDLNKIFLNKAKLDTAVRNARKIIEQKSNDKSELLNNFNILLEKRKSVSNDFTLKSLNELINEIILIHLKFNNEALKIDENYNSVLSASAIVNSQLNSLLEENSNASVRLSKFEEYIKDYIANKRVVESSKLLLDKRSEEHNQLKIAIEELKKKIKTENDGINELKLQLNSLSEIRDSAAKIEPLINTIKSIDDELEKLKILVSERTKMLQEIDLKYKDYHEVSERHNSLAEKFINLNKSKSELSSKNNLIQEWINHNNKIQKIDSVNIPELNQKIDLINTSSEKMTIDFNEIESKLNNNKTNIDSLKGIHDSINEAVGIISNNLPDDNGNCPVCLAEYPPNELKERIKKAISYVNPLLVDALQKNKSYTDQYTSIKNLIENSDKDKLSLIKQLNDFKTEKSISINYINNQVLPNFNGLNNLIDAEKHVVDETNRIIGLEKTLTEEKISLPVLISSDEVIILNNEKTKYEREINENQAKIEVNKTKLVELQESLTNLNQKIGAKKIEDLRADTLSLDQLISNRNIELEKSKNIQTDLLNKFEENEKYISDEQKLIQNLEIKIIERLTAWKEEGFSNSPNQLALDERNKKLLDEKSTINKCINEFTKIDQELAKWKVAQEYLKIDADIKKMCDTFGEEEFKKRLENESNDTRIELEEFDKKKSALETLYTSVNSELEITNKYIEGINPTLKSLLNRVVVNPRFAKTVLSSYKYRNKPLADVSMLLNGVKTKVSDIASEAQLTDLQLTFLLSMANKYQWTPWKALLLDDPTQHHDLVHSASVFDLLRDYIVQKDYQILLGTHDSVHANFFKRKLDNDGIPVKLWSLKSDDLGVKAELFE